MTHWHAFAYTGHQRPKDSEARDPHAAAPPNEIDMWFRKPRSMLAATFADACPAAEWLESELTGHPPPAAAVSVASHLRAARDALARGADVYVGYYTATGRFLVRTLLACPRTGERCPQPPPV